MQIQLDTDGLPGADERQNAKHPQSLTLPDFPSPEYAERLFNAYIMFVDPLFNIIHSV